MFASQAASAKDGFPQTTSSYGVSPHKKTQHSDLAQERNLDWNPAKVNFSFPLVCHDLNRKNNDTLSQIPMCQDPLSLPSLVSFITKFQMFESLNEDSGARPCGESLLAQRERERQHPADLPPPQISRKEKLLFFTLCQTPFNSTSLLSTSVCSLPVKGLLAPPIKPVFEFLKHPWVTCFLKSCSLSIDNMITLTKYPERLFTFSLDKRMHNRIFKILRDVSRSAVFSIMMLL